MFIEYLNSENTDIAAKGRDIGNLRESVMNMLDSIGKSLYESKICDKSDLEKAAGMLENYIKTCDEIGNAELINEAQSFELNFMLLADTYSFSKQHLNEWINIGFDTFDDNDISDNSVSMKPVVQIKKVLPYNNNPRNKTFFRNGSMYAATRYSAGDIIEEAPVNFIHIEDTYSRPIRDLSFEVDVEKGLYAIPMGYASYYRNDEHNPNATYSFMYNPEAGNGHILIRASKPIAKNEEITVTKSQNCMRNPNYDRFRTRATSMQEIPVTNFRFQ